MVPFSKPTDELSSKISRVCEIAANIEIVCDTPDIFYENKTWPDKLDEFQIAFKEHVARIVSAAASGAREALARWSARKKINMAAQRQQLIGVLLHDFFYGPGLKHKPFGPVERPLRSPASKVRFQSIKGERVFLDRE
jgi:hypothetical protein